MRLRLDLPVMNVSPSGLRKLFGYVPVADATGKDMSASGLKSRGQGYVGLRPEGPLWVARALPDCCESAAETRNLSQHHRLPRVAQSPCR